MYNSKTQIKKIKDCPSQDDISKAVDTLYDQFLHVYQVLYHNGLSGPVPYPIKVDRDKRSHSGGITKFITISYHDKDVADKKGLVAKLKGDEPDDKIIKTAQMLIEGANKEVVDRRACCSHAEIVYCVCEISFNCPIHGNRCYGSHD